MISERVFKKIHSDLSETVIKVVAPASRDKDGTYVEREEPVTSIFISSSYGCPYSCTFCHLTENKTPYQIVTVDKVTYNVLEAVEEFGQDLGPVKLCFMGMGDPTIDTRKTVRVALDLIASNLDVKEIDISSVSYKSRDVSMFNVLTQSSGVPVRLFYSMHTGFDQQRRDIIGTSQTIEDSVEALKRFVGPVFVHYTPVEGLNDRLLDALSIARRIGNQQWQVRMLEFNPAEESIYTRPSREKLTMLYQAFIRYGVDVKWQVSKGHEEAAACGMFGKVL